MRPTWAEISLSALTHNYRVLKRHLAADVQLMAMVKANAYGHGAVECARALAGIGADWFGVALVEEGAELRAAGITQPICCLGGFWRGQADDVIAHDLTPVIFRLDMAEELNARAKAAGRVVNVHLKADTGMGRLGIAWTDVAAFAREFKRFEHLRLDGFCTHFAEADALDHTFTDLQIDRYEAALRALRELGFAPTWRHLASSPGIHAHPRAWGNLARTGAALYGLVRDVIAPEPEPFDVRPVLSLHSRIELLKDVPAGTPLGYGRTFTTARASRIAVLPIGYADGWRRALSNNARVIVRGGFAPIVGRVSMDLTLLDVTDVADAALGDEVMLIGGRDGLRITAEDVAERIGTISYEIVAGVSARVPRVYIG